MKSPREEFENYNQKSININVNEEEFPHKLNDEYCEYISREKELLLYEIYNSNIKDMPIPKMKENGKNHKWKNPFIIQKGFFTIDLRSGTIYSADKDMDRQLEAKVKELNLFEDK